MAEENGVYIQTELNTQGIVDGAKTIEKSLKDITKTAKETAKATDAAFKIKIDTGYDAFHEKEEIVDLADRYKELILKKKQLESEGFGLGHEEYDQTLKYLDEIKPALDAYKKSLGQTTPVESNAAVNVRTLTNAFVRLFNVIKNKVVSIFRKLGGVISQSAKRTQEATNNIKKLILAGLGIFSIYKIARKLFSATQEGLRNLVQYSNETDQSVSALKNSLLQFKNGLAGAFAPVISVVCNGLATLVGYANNAVTALSNLISYVTGKSTFIKATEITDSYAESLDKAGGAAKQLQTYSFDTISKASGTSGGGSGITLAKDMFEEVETYEPGERMQKLIEFWRKTSDLFKESLEKADFFDFGAFISDTLKNGVVTANKWLETQGKTYSYRFGKSISTFFNGIFADKEMASNLGQTLANVVNDAFYFMWGIVSNFNFSDAGEYVGTLVNKFLEKVDAKTIGATIGSWIKGKIDFVKEFINTLDPVLMGQRLADFFAGLNIGELIVSITELLETAFNNACAALLTFWEEADTGTKTVISLFAGIKIASVVASLTSTLLPIVTQVMSAIPKTTTASQAATQAGTALGGTMGGAMSTALKAAVALAVADIAYNIGTGLSIEDDMWKNEAKGMQGLGKAISAALQSDFIEFQNNQRDAYTEILKQAQQIFYYDEEGYAKNLGSLVQMMKDSGLSVSDISKKIVEIIKDGSYANREIYKASIEDQTEYNRKKSGFYEEQRKMEEEATKHTADQLAQRNNNAKVSQDTITRAQEATLDAIKQRYAGEKLESSSATNAIEADNERQGRSAEGLATTTDNVTMDVIANAEVVKNTLEETKTVGQQFADVIKEVFNVMTSSISAAFHALPGLIKEPLNSIIENVETMVNGCIGGIGSLASALTSAKTSGADIKTFTAPTNISIPRLATGAVIPPNAPFFAQLGDQKNGTNLEAPEGLIRKIIREEIGSGNVSIEFTGDLAQLGRVLMPVIRREEKRKGRSLVN